MTGGGTSARYIQVTNGGNTTQIGTESSTGAGILTGSTAYASVYGSNGAVPLQFGTTNTVRMTIGATGNVGIGTTTPDSLLTVNTAGLSGSAATNKGSIQIIANADINAGAGGLEFKSSTASNGYGWKVAAPDRSNSNVPLSFAYRNASATWTEAVTIGSGGAAVAGGVGIGTTTPANRLTVNGGVQIEGAVSTPTNSPGLFMGHSSGASQIYSLNNNVAWLPMGIDASTLSLNNASGGGVNIGTTTTAGGRLTIQGAANNTSGFFGNASACGATYFAFNIGLTSKLASCTDFNFLGDQAGAIWLNRPTGQSLRIMEGNSAVDMLFASGGLTGVGTSSQLSRFTIFSSTGPQINLSSGAGSSQWALRAVNNNLYFATTTTTTTATSSVAALQINGNGTLIVGGGTGKITVGTFDPVYTVDGVAYATYAAGMIGIKEETTGIADITTPITAPDGTNGYASVIDFDDEPVGSDLWLFAQTTHIRRTIDRLVVLLSAEDGHKVWYTIDRAERKVYLLSDKPTRVSYRMTAPRFDYEEWSNFNHDGVTGFTPPTGDLTEYFATAPISFGGLNLLAGTTTIAELTTAGNPSLEKPWVASLSGVSAGLKNAMGVLSASVVEAFEGAQYFADGIFERVFAAEVHTDKICVSDENGETCLTRAQLDALIAGAVAAQNPPPPEAPQGGGPEEGGADTEAPVVTVNGNNPAEITVGDTYADFGATVTDNVSQNLGYSTFVNGEEVTTVSIDTSVPGTHTILYRAVDQAGNIGEATRTVVVSEGVVEGSGGGGEGG